MYGLIKHSSHSKFMMAKLYALNDRIVDNKKYKVLLTFKQIKRKFKIIFQNRVFVKCKRLGTN